MPGLGNRSNGSNTISFHINGKHHEVPLVGTYSASTSLNDYIRNEAGLTGTKVMCREAGCGCCAVSVTTADHAGNGHTTQSINSCLCPLASADGWQITTVEGLGGEKEGYHPIQKRIADFNGTQCGYCTPGIVMAMYGLLHEKSRPTEQEVEDNFDGNICRCTGYRSILDAMKSFAADTSIEGGGVIDIEDLNKKLCPRTGEPCTDDHSAANGADICGLHVQIGGSQWFRPTSLTELGGVMRNAKDKKMRLLFGNTSTGIFKNEGPFDVYIDIREVKDLYEIKETETSVKFGANTSLSTFIKKLKELKDSQPGFHYFPALVKHLKLVGNVLMRNAASIAGNLMIKHNHHDFPSDVFATTEALGAKVEIYDSKDGSRQTYTVQDFVRRVNMKGKVLVSLELPALDTLDTFRSYKVTPRSQNAHAYVNAAFKLKISSGRQILGKPSIVIGGISKTFFHAEKTEDFLRGKEIKDAVVKEALALLQGELKPSADPVLAPPQYRRDLAVNLLYKTLLGITAPSDAKMASGSSDIERPLSSGIQTWQDKKDEWPLKQALPKKTAKLQASGEAEYVNDIPKYKQELCGALVLTSVASATIESIDPAPALAIPGVEQYITWSDIPEGGINNAYARYTTWPLPAEEVFCEGQVEYAGQAVGMILAENQDLADEAAKKVVIKYKDVKKPILTFEDAIEAKSTHSCFVGPATIGNPDEAIAQSDHQIEGEVRIGQQYHFYMETICSLCVPGEEGMEVYITTQAGDVIQIGVSGILNKPQNYVNVHVPRLGGSFGGKFFTSSHIALATAVASYATGKPVRTSTSLSNTMKTAGKRPHLLAKYKVGCTREGKINGIIMDVYMDNGKSNSMQFAVAEFTTQMDQGYHCPNWRITPTIIKTNKAPSAPVRGPGTTPCSAMIETILEHVANAVKKHPILVKEINLYEKDQKDITGQVLRYCTMRQVWDKLKTEAEVPRRMDEIEAYNRANTWKKRGITMAAVKYGMMLMDHGMPLLLSVYAGDGTVTVVQGGVEMGQGLYMKVAQAVAHGLGIPVDMVKVRPNLSYVVPNSSITGGSTTSERAVYAALEACKTLREKMDPIKAKLPPDADWQTLVKASLKAKIDLAAKSTPFAEGAAGAAAGDHHAYFTYCAAVAETNLDVLTGEYGIDRVDIMFDCGESLNPMIDIGQIEGGFVCGLGFNLLEDIVYDKDTGAVLNDGTWEYKPPTTKDIPIDWRIHLLPDAPNPVGIRSSKATGEPSTGLSAAAMLSLKRSVEEASKDLTGSSTFVPVDIPFTLDKIQQNVGIKLEHLKM
ncbi:uncharacterized protein [Littorina saxatilis]|uniref:FAD-binding PCMH-type domain-containing protein n=1 Tax=Littorina saxatilis TaxID=31220 RepID=A0AAN9GL07_9CAEN